MSLFSFPDTALIRPDSLSWVMAGLIVFVVVIVLAYSRRSMAGDRNGRAYYRNVVLLGVSALVMVFADNLLLVLAGWAISNLLLVNLMIHKSEWVAARNSGLLALKTFALSSSILAGGFWLLAESAGTASIHDVNSAADRSSPLTVAGLLLVALAALAQSGALPFHRWLVSSLNSPTPVSALMHAGLVNGGGFLLARFAPLYLKQPALLHGLFVAGLATAVVGTFWKLLQSDVKRMLACSTMGQMGFMLMQFGMGLFAPAVSHLCWHGLFKAYLFLNAGSVVREKRVAVSASGNLAVRIPFALLAGIAGAAAFALISGIDPRFETTGCLMAGFAFMAAAQLAWALLEKSSNIASLVAAPVVGLGSGGLYGLSVRLVEGVLTIPNQAQPLDVVYAAGFAVAAIVWIALNLNLASKLQSATAWQRLYVAALNGSQPHPKTVTAIRTTYIY